jgi:hypothetical protein
MIKENLDGSSLTFQRDEQISFEESTHTYRVDGIGEMTPVSSVVAMFFKPFDAVYWSKKKCGDDVFAAAKLREEWESGGAVASQAGTHLHRQIENYLNHGTEPELKCNISYNGAYVHKSLVVDIAQEWSLFEAFDRDTDYHPFRTEWCVFDEETRMAGTIDLLCSRDDGTFEIYDWKRSNKIDPNVSNTWTTGINGLEHLPDTSYAHYLMQQNLYRYMLEKNYGLTVSRMNLVVLHPDFDSYKIIPVPIMPREVATVVNLIKNRP